MYTAQDIAEFKQRTDLLLRIHDLDEATRLVNDLRDVLNFHDHRYYVMAEPIITDPEYDKLFKTLKSVEEAHPELATEDSPTQRVAYGLTKEFPSVNHLVPMLSLDNSYDEEDLLDFDRKVKDLAGTTNIRYAVEPKFDGSSISLVYEDDRLVRGVTRGDGIMGEDITPNLKAIKSVPMKAAFSKYGIKTIEIRGEVMIRKDRFQAFNEARTEQGLAPLANPRNAAAGSVRLQDAKEVAKRGLEAFMYHVSYAVDEDGEDMLGEKIHSRRETIDMLHALGFKTPDKEMKVYSSVREVMEYLEEWAEKRDDYSYEIDGMVIKVDELEMEEKLGATSHHPRWAMAFKFQARQARTKLLKVDFQVGRVGTITPVAKLVPVAVGGVTVSSVSLFNEDFIRSKDLRIGDEVLVERAGDVIPYIAGVLTEARTGNETPVEFPTHCPSCGSELVRTGEEAAWRCVNIACPAQVYERLLHFVSKNAMDISGLGKALIERFIQEGWLRTIPDIYRLPFDQMEHLEGFGHRSAEKLKESINKSLERPPHRLLFGLGVRYVGETTAKDILENIHCIEDLKDWDIERLTSIEGVGPKVAQSVFDFFQTPENLEMLEELKSFGLQTCRPVASGNGDGGELGGLTFLFTGTLEKFNRHEAKEMVENAGGKVAGSLSSKVNYLVVGADPGSKVDKAKKLGTVKVITEDEFLKMVEEE